MSPVNVTTKAGVSSPWGVRTDTNYSFEALWMVIERAAVSEGCLRANRNLVREPPNFLVTSLLLLL